MHLLLRVYILIFVLLSAKGTPSGSNGLPVFIFTGVFKYCFQLVWRRSWISVTENWKASKRVAECKNLLQGKQAACGPIANLHNADEPGFTEWSPVMHVKTKKGNLVRSFSKFSCVLWDSQFCVPLLMQHKNAFLMTCSVLNAQRDTVNNQCKSLVLTAPCLGSRITWAS